MTKQDKVNILEQLNEKQMEINHIERMLGQLYDAEERDQERIDNLEEAGHKAIQFRNGMIYAMNCLGAFVEYKAGTMGIEWKLAR